jgi:hypothetical protein
MRDRIPISLLHAKKGMSLMSKLAMSKTLFLIAAFVSFLLSVYLWFGGSKEQGLFVGIWVPSILSLGALMMAGTKSS